MLFTKTSVKKTISRFGLALLVGLTSFLFVFANEPRAQEGGADSSVGNRFGDCDGKPPAISGRALRDEIVRYGDTRKNEINELKKLKAEIEESRSALRAEIEVLETRIAEYARKKEQEEEEKALLAETPLEKKKREARLAEDRLRMAKAFRGMEPKDAARLISRLETQLAADLLRLMRPADAGKILAELSPRKAAVLTTKVAGKKKAKPKKKAKEKKKEPQAKPPKAKKNAEKPKADQ